MAYGESRKKKKRDILGTQIEVYNVNSGCQITMDDDGVSKDTGQANQQRAHVLRKLAQKDADGDPMFVLVTPLKKHTLEADRFAGGGQELAGRRELDDGSKSPDFKSLRDKYEANKAARQAFMKEFEDKRASVLPAKAETKSAASKKAASKKADKAAAGAVKPGPEQGAA